MKTIHELLRRFIFITRMGLNDITEILVEEVDDDVDDDDDDDVDDDDDDDEDDL